MEHAKRLAIGLLVLAAFLALFLGLLYLVLNFDAARVVLLGTVILAAAYSIGDLIRDVTPKASEEQERMERLPPEFETAIYSNLEVLYEESNAPTDEAGQEPGAG